MIDFFLEYITKEKRFSENTVISYRKDLEDFRKFYLKTEGSEEITLADKKNVRNFIVELSERKLTKRSINRKLSTLRSFYNYLLKIDEIKVSPIESIQSLKFYAEKQIPFSEEELQRLSERYPLHNEENILELLIIETLYQTGMRNSELCNLLLENVSFKKKEIRIIGKGNKERVVPISENLIDGFMKYLKIRKPVEESSKFFFINKKGKKLNSKFVYSVVNSYFSTITSKQKKSPHILRHSFATHVLDNGAEISKVKTIMGHSSLASTQVYTNANIEQLKKVFNKAHPRAKENNEDGEIRNV